MSYDVSRLRTDDGDMPYRTAAVTFVHITGGGLVSSDNTVTGKSRMLDAMTEGDVLLGAWTGRHRTDVFALDVERARAALR